MVWRRGVAASGVTDNGQTKSDILSATTLKGMLLSHHYHYLLRKDLALQQLRQLGMLSSERREDLSAFRVGPADLTVHLTLHHVQEYHQSEFSNKSHRRILG